MRIEVRLPKVEPEVYDIPEQCPDEKCNGKHYERNWSGFGSMISRMASNNVLMRLKQCERRQNAGKTTAPETRTQQ